jgi:hypothetical protein
MNKEICVQHFLDGKIEIGFDQATGLPFLDIPAGVCHPLLGKQLLRLRVLISIEQAEELEKGLSSLQERLCIAIAEAKKPKTMQ